MEAHKSNYKLDVYLPRTVDQDGATAQFNNDSKVNNVSATLQCLLIALVSYVLPSSKYLIIDV